MECIFHIFKDLVQMNAPHRLAISTQSIYIWDLCHVLAVPRSVFEGLPLTGSWTSGHSISQGMQLLRPLSEFLFHDNSTE